MTGAVELTVFASPLSKVISLDGDDVVSEPPVSPGLQNRGAP
jgi:hypothetical protein